MADKETPMPIGIEYPIEPEDQLWSCPDCCSHFDVVEISPDGRVWVREWHDYGCDAVDLPVFYGHAGDVFRIEQVKGD